MRRPAASSGCIATPTPGRSSSAAARTIAASPFSATRCSWARSTATWSRSTPEDGTPGVEDQRRRQQEGYSITVAPLASKDRVVVGVGGGEYGIRGFIAAFDAQTGKELWRFYTIPGPGEPGHETWEACPPNPKTYCDPEAWKHGGGSVWVTGSYDPELNLTYWGTGNVGSGLQRRSAAGRQPLHGVGRRARCRHRQAEMALPVHAARSLRLRLGAGAGARRHHVAGRAREGDAVGEPQRQLLRARSRDRQVPARQAVREGELDERLRRQRPADSNSAAAGHADLSRQCRAARTGTRRRTARARS